MVPTQSLPRHGSLLKPSEASEGGGAQEDAYGKSWRRGSGLHLAASLAKKATSPRGEARDSQAAGSPGSAADSSPGSTGAKPLDWTYLPRRDVESDGNVIYQVSAAAAPPIGHKRRPLHLMREVMIEPSSSRSKRTSLRSSSGPPRISGREVASGGGEQITVMEADFRKFGHELALLRQCQVKPEADMSPEDESSKNELEVSFKSAFATKCRMPEELRDPWKNVLKHPEEVRTRSEADLILNQVWPEAASPPRPQREKAASPQPVTTRTQSSPAAVSGTTTPRRRPSPGGDHSPTTTALPSSRRRRATSVDAATAAGPLHVGDLQELARKAADSSPAGSASRQGTAASTARRPPRPGRPNTERSRTEQADEGLGALKRSNSGRVTASRDSSRESISARSGRQRPSSLGARIQAVGPPLSMSKYKSPIQVREDFDPNNPNEQPFVGSIEVRKAAQSQRHFIRGLEEYMRNTKRAIWVSLDSLTGELQLYPKDVAKRLESAYCNNRTTIPLAGLGEQFEEAIVYLEGKEEGARHLQKTWRGGQRDVRRLEVPISSSEVSLPVVHRGTWHVAHDHRPANEDVASSDAADNLEPQEGIKHETRTIPLSGTEFVRPPSPVLPPVDPNRRQHFWNVGHEFGS